jgi:hypothetical protein
MWVIMSPWGEGWGEGERGIRLHKAGFTPQKRDLTQQPQQKRAPHLCFTLREPEGYAHP